MSRINWINNSLEIGIFAIKSHAGAVSCLGEDTSCPPERPFIREMLEEKEKIFSIILIIKQELMVN
jgi:hypothetical protein